MQQSFTFPHHGEAERWLPVVGWAGFYDVSNLGRVRSLPRFDNVGHRVRGCILKPIAITGGYLVVTLCRDGTQVIRRVHHLVLEAFVGPCPAGMEACHGPLGDRHWLEQRQDNRLANLRWGTKKENQGDRLRDGTSSRGEQHGSAVLTWAIVSDVRRRTASGERQCDLAREYGVSPELIQHVIRGNTWVDPDSPYIPAAADKRGENNGNAKLAQADLAEICRRASTGETHRVIARDYGVARSTISRVVRGTTWA